MPRYNYQFFLIDLATAGKDVIEIEGGHVYIKDATDTLANVDFQVDDNTADKVKLVRKTGFIGRFKKLYVSWAAQPGKTITVLVSSSYEDFRVMEQQIGDVNVVNASIPVTSASTLQVASASALLVTPEESSTLAVGQVTLVTSGTAYQIVAANSKRRRLVIERIDAWPCEAPLNRKPLRRRGEVGFCLRSAYS